jgi:hypothetical protein
VTADNLTLVDIKRSVIFPLPSFFSFPNLVKNLSENPFFGEKIDLLEPDFSIGAFKRLEWQLNDRVLRNNLKDEGVKHYQR